MEKIQDLDILINDGKKIARFARMFTRLPEILGLIGTYEGHCQELQDKIEREKSTLDKINSAVSANMTFLDSVEGKVTEMGKVILSAELSAKARVLENRSSISGS